MTDSSIENTPEHRNELLELYKLHAELVDRIIQRWGNLNRQYLTIMSSLLVLASIAMRFSNPGIVLAIILIVLGFVGMAIATAWYGSTGSYTILYIRKSRILFEMEKTLPFSFVQEEVKHQILNGKKPYNIKFSEIQFDLPLIFMCVSTCLLMGACAYYIHERFQINIIILLGIVIPTFILFTSMVFIMHGKIQNDDIKTKIKSKSPR